MVRQGALLVTLWCACAAAPPERCTPSSCGGCCDGTDCRAGDTNELCGLGGVTCSACPPGKGCSVGACITDGAGGGNACVLSCPGCCAGQICIPPSVQSGANCGTHSLCATCSNGFTCINGSCQPPPMPMGSGVGRACSGPQDCDGVPLCKLTTTLMTTPYPDGYCTLDCSSQACPSDAFCVFVPEFETTALCAVKCITPGSSAGCRSGYFCVLTAMGFGLCWPPNALPAPDGG